MSDFNSDGSIRQSYLGGIGKHPNDQIRELRAKVTALEKELAEAKDDRDLWKKSDEVDKIRARLSEFSTKQWLKERYDKTVECATLRQKLRKAEANNSRLREVLCQLEHCDCPDGADLEEGFHREKCVVYRVSEVLSETPAQSLARVEAGVWREAQSILGEGDSRQAWKDFGQRAAALEAKESEAK